MVITTETRLREKLQTYKRLIYGSVLIFLGFAFWQGYSALQLHSTYQQNLMESVINRISNEYQLLVSNDQAMLNEFQIQHQSQLLALYDKGAQASKEEYMAVLTQLREANSGIRLFSIISPEQIGLFSHITGDFLPDCKEEIHSTFQHQQQDELFLHRSKSSIHYDLLLPLFERPGAFLFVAFNVDTIQELLTKFSLPHQELFLLRNDKVGKIELSSTNEVTDNIQSLVMTTDEIASFSFIQPIPKTRWNLAIRLTQKYRTEIIQQSLIRAIFMTLFFCLILVFLYRVVFRSTSQLIQVRDYIYQKQKYDPLTGAFTQNEFVSILSEKLAEQNSSGLYVLSFRFIDQRVKASENEHYSDFYTKHFASALMTFLGEGYEFGRVNDMLFVTSHKLTSRRVNYVAQSAVKYVEDYNKKYEDALKVQVVALSLDDNFSSGIQLIRAISGVQERTQDTSLTLLHSDSPEVTQVFEDQHLLSKLREAIDNESILLYRQAISCIGSKTEPCEQYEILCRLQVDDEIVPPIKFIPLAEQTGLIVELDKLMIKKSLEKLAPEPEHVSLSINLSGKTLTHPDLKQFIEDNFRRHKITPARITFEVTETYAVSNINVAKDFIAWARDLGCEFSLDDFGQGVSSFSYLQSLPISKLKIDGCFIRDIHTNDKNRILVKTMVSLCQQLQLKSVAEFVENKEIVKVLDELGVDYGQGYGIHRPEHWH